MDDQTEVSIPEAIYESREALETYLADVKIRREQRRIARQMREYFQYAVRRVCEELAQAETDQDEEISLELREALAGFQRRLGMLSEKAAVRSLIPLEATTTETSLHPPEIIPDVLTDLMDAPDQIPNAYTEVGSLSEALPEEHPSSEIIKDSIPPPISEPGLSAEEQEVRLQTLRTEIDGVAQQRKEITRDDLTDKNGELNRPLCFRLRSLACTLGSLHARAHEDRLEQMIAADLHQVKDSMEQSRDFANDRTPCPPFEDLFWVDGDQELSSDEWEELAARYARMAVAQQAWDWYALYYEGLGQDTRLSLLNAITAVQQALYRTLDDFNGRDRLQTEIYVKLVDAARQTGYLTALSQETNLDDLEALGATLGPQLEVAMREWTDNCARQAKEARKHAALTAVIDLFAQRPDLGISGSDLERDRIEVLPLLDECIAAGIPPSNVYVRNGLLHYGPQLLQDQPKYSKILDSILGERRRRGIDAENLKEKTEDEGELSSAAISEQREFVSLFATGKKVLILGGTPRQRTCDELKEALTCGDVQWLASKKSDRIGKFESAIKRANILLLAKNFAGHDMSEKGREWIRGVGGHFIYLPSGYGVNQIIHQLYTYVMAQEARG